MRQEGDHFHLVEHPRTPHHENPMKLTEQQIQDNADAVKAWLENKPIQGRLGEEEIMKVQISPDENKVPIL